MKKSTLVGLFTGSMLLMITVPAVYAEEYVDGGYEEAAPEYFEEPYFGEEEYYEDEYYEEEYIEENNEEYTDTESESETETETETERGKSDKEYGENEAHERRKPEDGYLYRNNPKESKFEDFHILKKQDAEEVFDLRIFKDLPKKYSLDVPEVLQRPELPTGCESVSLTMALKYYGFELTKTEIAAEFLLYNLSDENAAIGFIGDPFDDSGAGCFAPALAATADNFFVDQGYDFEAFDISGTNMESLLSYIAADTPVLVWTTMYMEPVEFSEEFGVYEDKKYQWYKYEHCVLLTGYDLKKKTLQVNDPLDGIVTRDMEEFTKIYDEVGQYAVVLKDMTGVTVIEETNK